MFQLIPANFNIYYAIFSLYRFTLKLFGYFTVAKQRIFSFTIYAIFGPVASRGSSTELLFFKGFLLPKDIEDPAPRSPAVAAVAADVGSPALVHICK